MQDESAKQVVKIKKVKDSQGRPIIETIGSGL